MTSPYRKRTIAAAVVFVAFAGSAALGAMLWHTSPADICLCPVQQLKHAFEAPSTQPTDTMARLAPTPQLALGASKVDGLSALPPLPPQAAATEARSLSHGEGLARGWAAWGNSSDRRVTSASSGGSHGAALGSLWSAMSPFGGHRSAASSPHSAAPHTSATGTKAPSSARPPSARPSPAPAPAPAAPALPPTASASPWPMPTLPTSGVGAIAPLPVPGGAVGSVGGGIRAAATPEPGSLLLIGTGLLGVVGILRRRTF